MKRGAIVVAAAGNQGGMLGSSAVTRHPWVIPVGNRLRSERQADERIPISAARSAGTVSERRATA